MNREKAAQLAKVMQAYADGKEVQYSLQHPQGKIWKTSVGPTFNQDYEWRIKPEPKRTAGYRTYYFQGSKEIMLTQVWGGIPPSEILRIENSESFIKWKHTELQYDDVEVE